MNIVVLLKMVPDTVEELNVGADGRSLDAEFLRYKLGDPDEHAIEQALLLKEKHGGTVTLVALDAPEVDDVLFTALAKGADRAIKLTGAESPPGTPVLAQAVAACVRGVWNPLPADTLILCGSYAIDDLEGELAPWLATAFEIPLAMVVAGVQIEDGGRKAVVTREFFGGLRGEFELDLPAILGIQSAEKPPRYVPIAKVRAAMKSARIDSQAAELPEPPAGLELGRMAKPEAAGHAQMLEGDPDKVADQIIEVLAQQSLI
ncbi:MAG TPA: electron transfer flavoprotein subunit beta/FixA family protein [Candidatus Paceibacterota bacterium]|nr:electron transfer flavoprotein subunit beta/FixA family protein [Verrucomicrobiota bacterium]HOX03880.1 electron transfer flavoprotein subunit beta/FixA family protein [Verrucomicrobiota bacterium]HRZ46757.1 electron transfer flavoprotein subunit beta/FixA family protein [Candidatus Paceibacterota bacterium]HRZ94121.1 electron transfer flavoprotein subunit beta/FixA family protein [Candidatus Paceibacterota bacterium]